MKAMIPALLNLALILAIAGDDPRVAPRPGPTPDEQFRALRDAHQAAFDAFVKADEEAKTAADRAKVLDHPGRQTPAFMPPFLDLAKKYPGTTAAEDSLFWVATHAVMSTDSEEAKKLLTRDFVRSAKLGPALGFQGHYADYSETSEAFFREVLAKNPDRDIRGLATYWLARHLLNKAQGAKLARKNPSFGKDFVSFYRYLGEDWTNRLRKLDPDALESEADSFFERVAKFHADIPHNDKRRKPGTLGEAARSYLREGRELAVGKPAPEFEGTDLDGRPFRLKDQRGKVVLLDFGSHFYCGSCRLMYPKLKELTKRLEGRPFVVVSINAEPEKDRKQLKEAWAEAGNTWPCLFDGDWEGPIQKAWNVTRFPTVYVLDAAGTIRLKNDLGNDLGNEIDRLVGEAEKAVK
jgi:cytochrome oxidase Cu insertion factor (SCO1/SenC/PrrC family)